MILIQFHLIGSFDRLKIGLLKIRPNTGDNMKKQAPILKSQPNKGQAKNYQNGKNNHGEVATKELISLREKSQLWLKAERQKIKERRARRQKSQQIRTLQQKLKALNKTSAQKLTKSQPKEYIVNFQLQRTNPAAKVKVFFTSVEEHVALDMPLLKEKIWETFPEIKNRRLVLSWVDSEGDKITVTNSKALQFGFKEMSGPIYK